MIINFSFYTNVSLRFFLYNYREIEMLSYYTCINIDKSVSVIYI